MTEQEMVKMSPKGQLVVPQEIRKLEKFRTGDRFVAFPVKEGVLFKRIDMPKVKIEFEKLAREIATQFKKKRVKKKDVEGAIGWARR